MSHPQSAQPARSERFGSTTFALTLFGAAFLLRAAFLLAFRDPSVGPVQTPKNFSGDDVQFEFLGWSLAQGEGFVSNTTGEPTAFRAPGYPFLLAGIYLAVGRSHLAVYLIHLLLGAASCVLTWRLARRLLPERSARLAGWLTVVYLPAVFFGLDFISENLFLPLFLLANLLLVDWIQNRAAAASPGVGNLGLGRLACAGVILGLATLTRPFSMLLAATWGLLILWRERRSPLSACVAGLVFGASCLAVVLPWTIRNRLEMGHWVVIASNGGSTFYGSNNDIVANQPRKWGTWVSTTELPGRDLIDAQPDEVSHDRMEWKLGLDWIRGHPGAFARLLAFKFASLWARLPEMNDSPTLGLYVLRAAGYAPFLILFGLGFLRVFRDRRFRTAPWMVLHLGLLATVLTALIFGGLPRFRDANAGLLMIYAVVGLGWLLRSPADEFAAEPKKQTTPGAT